MRFQLPVLIFACLSIAASARAGRFELGPRLALSVPTGAAGDEMVAGIDAGVTATFMETPSAGVGLDLGYQHWPGSPDAEAEFDAMLSRMTGTRITGTKWSLSTFEAAGYAKAVAPIRSPITPWIRAGVGYYYVMHHLELLGASMDGREWKFGYAGGVGFDVATHGMMKYGLDASYRYLLWKNDAGENVTAFTIGGHLLFGPR